VLRGNEATPWQIALATMARRRHVFLFSIYDLNMACVSKLYASIANYVAEASAGTLIGISSAGNRLTGATPAETRRTKDMRNFELDPSLLSEQRDVAEMIADMAGSEPDICSRSASALAQVCRGIITGEGPTAAGRVHFSRTIDIQDTGLCTHILVVAGRDGRPVSRVEVDALLDIHAVASDRQDDGRFDDLLTKAVVHHMMSASGLDVPRRECALDPATPLATWALRVRIDRKTTAWLEARLAETRRPSPAARAIARAIAGTEPTIDLMVAVELDLAA
jgi:hypothetical protein